VIYDIKLQELVAMYLLIEKPIYEEAKYICTQIKY